jgi:AraC-like DNA-binding protein
MPRPSLPRAPILQQTIGFNVWRGTPRRMERSHMHSDIECNFLLSGSLNYFAAGNFHSVESGEFTVFWAGMPHEIVRVAPESEIIWAVLPLTWFLQWQLPTPFTNRLLKGEFIREAAPSRPDVLAMDQAALRRWVADLNGDSPSPHAKKIVMLELQARLLRMASQNEVPALRNDAPLNDTPLNDASFNDATSQHVRVLASFISQNYQRDISISDIASAAALHPNYAMQVFKQGCGMSLWDYLLRLRVSHAQRLLLSTNLKIGQIALQSGFNSMTRFYATFTEQSGRTPREFRKLGQSKSESVAS